MADLLGLHTSTISRAIKNKYLECTQGLFSLKYFFPTSLNHYSSTQAIALLRNFIEGEVTPLSDNTLCQLLNERGIPIARRTVAKYREAAGIPPSNLRQTR